LISLKLFINFVSPDAVKIVGNFEIVHLKTAAFVCGFSLRAFGRSSSKEEELQTRDQPVTISTRDLAYDQFPGTAREGFSPGHFHPMVRRFLCARLH
jgi:hypothetical protein